MKKVLVTGGLGYIGSHTVVELLKSGFDVIVVDDLSNSSIDIKNRIEVITKKSFTFIQEDLKSLGDLKTIFTNHRIDFVIHFAAYKAVGESVSNPLKYYRNNLFSLINVLECIKKSEVNNIVFSSSATVYGEQQIQPIKECFELQTPNNPYGKTKRFSEEILADSIAAKFLDSCISLRYFNPIGAHESGLIGEEPTGIPNNLMPYITQTAKGIRDCLTVFGDDYDTIDGTGVRDYIHVVDLAKAHVKALEYIHENPKVNFKAINIGTGKGISVLEIIKAFEQANHIKIPYKIGKRRSGDIAVCLADPTNAKELLGWTAQRNIFEMVESAWRFEKNNLS